MLHSRAAAKSKITVEDRPIRLAGVVRESIVDGPELRFVVFVQGCPHDCPGCQNPETHDYNGGFMTSTTKLWAEIDKNPMLKGVTFSGGEPFVWASELAVIGRAAKEKGLSVMTYTGYLYERLLDMAREDKGVRELLTVTDYLVDGPFIEAQRDLGLLFRGSRNQRIIDVENYPNSEAIHVIEKFDRRV